MRKYLEFKKCKLKEYYSGDIKDKHTFIKSNPCMFNTSNDIAAIQILQYPNILLDDRYLQSTIPFQQQQGYYIRCGTVNLTVPYSMSYTIQTNLNGSATCDTNTLLGVKTNSNAIFNNDTLVPGPGNGDYVGQGRLNSQGTNNEYTLISGISGGDIKDEVIKSPFPSQNCVFTLRELTPNVIEYNVYDVATGLIDKSFKKVVYKLNGTDRFLWYAAALNKDPYASSTLFTMVASPF